MCGGRVGRAFYKDMWWHGSWRWMKCTVSKRRVCGGCEGCGASDGGVVEVLRRCPERVC